MRYYLIILLLTVSLLAFGCSNPATSSNSTANANKEAGTNSNTENPLGTTKTPEAATTNEAPTFSPLVKAYCVALIKKDDAALRKLHSADTLKIYDADWKSENKSSLVEFLYELDPIKDASKCGARNEKIEGDKGTAEIRNENMPGIKVEFVKENGEWKMTNKSPDIEAVKQSATNSNAAK